MTYATKFLSLPTALQASAVALALLIGAYTFQYGFGYAPCELCWWQRYPYFIIMGLAILAVATGKSHAKPFLWAVMILFAVDATIAGFHAGVEQKWWEGLSTCSGNLDLSGDLSDVMKSIMDAPIIKCDEIAWSLFGISMAGYNFLIATLTTIFCAIKLKEQA